MKKQLYKIILILFAVLQNFTIAFGSDLIVSVKLDPTLRKAQVSGRFSDDSRVGNRKNLGFLTPGTDRRSEVSRIEGLIALDRSGKRVDLRQLIDSEYLAETEFHSWTYFKDLSPATGSSAAGVSWLAEDRGILILDDLLPQFVVNGGGASCTIQITLGDGWEVGSTADRIGGAQFLAEDASKAVFIVGKDLRSTRIKLGDFEADVILNSTWHFSDMEAARTIEEILGAYKGIFGTMPSRSAHVAILRPPVERGPDFWEAETRGNTIVIISSDTAFSDRSRQRLHEQLRHELFHLWLPNGVRLTGEYAWFYEGFALYSSLKLGVKVRRIRFQDLLETLSRTYAIDSRQNPRIPLLGLGQPIAGPPNTQTYARGLLIAFLVDLELMRSSSERSDSAGLLRSIFQEFKDRDKPVDANEALMSINVLRNTAQRFVFGSEAIDLVKELNGTGIETVQSSGQTKLSVRSKLNGREQKILDALGYNSWRGSPRVQKR